MGATSRTNGSPAEPNSTSRAGSAPAGRSVTSRPAAPAARAARAKAAAPCASSGLRYEKITTGTSGRAAARSARAASAVIPPASAACELAWITGPSAIGSLKGRPSSTTSTPAAPAPRRKAVVCAGSGCPAVT